MKKTLIISLVVVLFLLALPTLINFILFVGYEHGNEYLTLEEGAPGTLIGKWSGTFDTYQCGLDERHRFIYTFDSDSTGIIDYYFHWERYLVGGTGVYSWSSIFPFNKSKYSKYRAHVKKIDNYLVIEPSEIWFTSDTLYVHYLLDNEKLYFGYVNSIGEKPEMWGLNFSWSDKKINFSDLITKWWD